MLKSLCLVLAVCLGPTCVAMAGHHELGLKSNFEHRDKLVPMNIDMIDNLGGNSDLYGDIRGFITLYPGNELIVAYKIGNDEKLFHIWNSAGLKSLCPITRDIATNDERNFYYISVFYLQHEFDICKERKNSFKMRGPWHVLSAALGPRQLNKLILVTSHQIFSYELNDYEPRETIYEINIDMFIRYILYPWLQNKDITIRDWQASIYRGTINFAHKGHSSSLAWEGYFKDPFILLRLIQKHVEHNHEQKEIFESFREIKFSPFLPEDSSLLINEQFVAKKLKDYLEQLKLIVPEQIYVHYEHEKVIELAFGDEWLRRY